MRSRDSKPAKQRQPIVESRATTDTPWWPAACVILLAVGVYANAFGNGHVWDDPIVLDRQLDVFKNVGTVFFPPRDIPQYSPDYYRPLTTLSYLLDRSISGTGPRAFHVSVVFYNALVSLLVWRLGVLLFGRERRGVWAATAAAALFAVHPIHSESVAWASGRSDVLAALGPLAALNLALDPRARAPWVAWVAASLVFLGLLAKETAFPSVVLLPLAVAWLGPDERRWQPYAVACGIAAAAYLTLRSIVLTSVAGGTPAAIDSETPMKILAAVGFYLRNLMLPIQQSAYISDLETSPLALLACVLGIAAALVAAAWSWSRDRRVTFLLTWLFLAIAPSLAIVVKIPAAPVAERYLYIPSIAFCLLVGWGVGESLRRWPSRAAEIGFVTGIALVVALGSMATIARNRVWASNMALWTDTAAKNQTDALPLRSLASAYIDQGDRRRATELFKQALTRRNDARGRYVLFNNLGSLALQEQNLDEAQKLYEQAAAIQPESEVLYNLGIIALQRALAATTDEEQQRLGESARRRFQSALDLNPHGPEIRVGLGQSLQALGQREAARKQFEMALADGLAEPTAGAVRRLLTAMAGK